MGRIIRSMDRLGIFAKQPVEGDVKTRLTPSLPPTIAAKLQLSMVLDAIQSGMAARLGRVALYWAGDSGQGSFADHLGVDVRYQKGADLGERLAGAFGELLAGADRAVVIGSDCPDLGPGLIQEAFAALADADLVLGPARDGGYYLIGLKKPSPELFRGISWSTSRVLAETLERAERLGLRARLLETLDDLDTPDDLVRFVARRSVADVAPGEGTEALLRQVGLLPERS
jgi:rSAM/selenodomain-associated transferase 1